MNNAEAELERKKQEAAELARKRADARKAHLLARADYDIREVDAFGQTERIPMGRMSRDGRQFSEKQAAVLRRGGIDPNKFGYRQGQAIIGKLIAEWKKKKESQYV